MTTSTSSQPAIYDMLLEMDPLSLPETTLHDYADDDGSSHASHTDDGSLSSTPTTPNGGQESDPVIAADCEPSPMQRLDSAREQEISPATLLTYRHPPVPPKRHGSVGQEQCTAQPRSSVHEILPWNTPTIRTRKIGDFSFSGHDRKCASSSRRASATVVNTPYTILERRASLMTGSGRRASEMSTRMRRESIAEKFEMEHTLSRPSSPAFVSPKRHSLCPSMARKVSAAFSTWSSDDDDDEDGVDRATDAEEMVMEDVTAQLTTARRVSRTDSATLPIYLNKSRNNSCVAPTRHATTVTNQSDTSDVVRLVTALQATHLEETRRLNEIIASLSTKVATLENELFHANARAYMPGAVATPSRSVDAWRSSAYRIDGTRGSGMYDPHQQQQSCSSKYFEQTRRMSAMSASPRSLSINQI